MWALTDDELEGLRTGYLARLLQLDHRDGPIRMSTLPFDWTDDNGVLWLGGARILSVSEGSREVGVLGGELTVDWNGATEELVARSQDGGVDERRLQVWTAIFLGEPPRLAAPPRARFSGTCELPEVPGDSEPPVIRLKAQSDLLLLSVARPFRFTPEQLARYSADDTFFDGVAALAAGVEE